MVRELTVLGNNLATFQCCVWRCHYRHSIRASEVKVVKKVEIARAQRSVEEILQIEVH